MSQTVNFTNVSTPKGNKVSTVKANKPKVNMVQTVQVNIPKSNGTKTTSSSTSKTSTTKTTNNTAPKTSGTKTTSNTTPKTSGTKTTNNTAPKISGTKTTNSTTPKTSETKTTNSNKSEYTIAFLEMVSKKKETQSTDTLKDVSSVNKTDETTKTETVSLESMLRAKYPNLKYHVFDASSGYWRTRNDYPHYLLYQDNIDTKALENWTPQGENPFYGSIDGRFTAPKEIKALSSVPVGTTAVVIHPKVQERMEKDPEYAKEIYDRIDKWFTFDKLRNEAMMPGITARSSWSVAIGEDGEIVNAQSHSQGELTYSESSSGTDMALDFWTERSLRHKYFMQLQLEGQLRHEMLLYGLTGTPKSYGLFDLAGGTLSSANLAGLMKLSQSFEMPSLSSQQMSEKAAAKAKLATMINSGELNSLGDIVSGMPLEDLVSIVKQEIWKS